MAAHVSLVTPWTPNFFESETLWGRLLVSQNRYFWRRLTKVEWNCQIFSATLLNEFRFLMADYLYSYPSKAINSGQIWYGLWFRLYPRGTNEGLCTRHIFLLKLFSATFELYSHYVSRQQRDFRVVVIIFLKPRLYWFLYFPFIYWWLCYHGVLAICVKLLLTSAQPISCTCTFWASYEARYTAREGWGEVHNSNAVNEQKVKDAKSMHNSYISISLHL